MDARHMCHWLPIGIMNNNTSNVNQLSIDFSNIPITDVDLEHYQSSDIISTSIHMTQSSFEF